MTQPIHLSMERNNRHVCNAGGCTHRRHNLSAYCKSHFKRANLYGDPNGKSLLRREYRREVEDASALINNNRDHVATTTAIEIIQAWLDAPIQGRAAVLGRESLRLSGAGVTAVDILIEATAVYMYSQRRPGNLPDDIRLDYQIGVAIFRLAPRPSYTTQGGHRATRRASGSSRRAMGTHWRKALGVFMLNAWTYINHREQEAQKIKDKLWTSFHPETTRIDN